MKSLIILAPAAVAAVIAGSALANPTLSSDVFRGPPVPLKPVLVPIDPDILYPKPKFKIPVPGPGCLSCPQEIGQDMVLPALR